MAHSFKVGDILACSWGATMLMASYYRVSAKSKHFVTVQELDTDEKGDGGFLTGTSTPKLGTHTNSEPMRRRVHTNGGREYVSISSYQRARKWSGVPLRYNHCD